MLRLLNSVPPPGQMMIPCLNLNDEMVVKDRAMILAQPTINFAGRLHLDREKLLAASASRQCSRAKNKTGTKFPHVLRATSHVPYHPELRMDSDVYSNVRFFVIFLRLWTNKI